MYVENELIEGDPMRMFAEETRFKVADIASMPVSWVFFFEERLISFCQKIFLDASSKDPWCDLDNDKTMKDALSKHSTRFSDSNRNFKTIF